MTKEEKIARHAEKQRRAAARRSHPQSGNCAARRANRIKERKTVASKRKRMLRRLEEVKR